MKKKKYTNETLFNTIVDILKDKGLYPDILDYHLAEHHAEHIKTCEWDTKIDLQFGGCEGIYLDVYAVGDIGKGKEKIRLGTFKTLYESRDAFYVMAKLQADFIWETRDFVNHHMEDFNWTGCDVKLVKDNVERPWKWVCSKERAIEALKEHIHILTRWPEWDFDYAVVIDNATGKEAKIKKEDIAVE